MDSSRFQGLKMIIAHTLYYSYAHSRMASQISMAFYLLRRQRKNHQGTTNLNSVFMYDEGEKQDFNTWLMHLEDYFTRNNITDDRVKIMDAHTAMAGKVQSFFSALRCSPQPPVTFHHAMELVREKFSGAGVFFEVMQDNDIDSYVNHFHRACREFVPKDEAARIRQLRHGLNEAIPDKLVCIFQIGKRQPQNAKNKKACANEHNCNTACVQLSSLNLETYCCP